MGSAMFNHRIAYLQGQVRVCRADGKELLANALESLIVRINRGIIRTVTELDKAQEVIINNKDLWK